MLTILQNLLNSNSFIPHGHCYLWKTPLVLLNVISDALIALTYYSIPIVLVYIVRKRNDLPFNSVFFLFSGFILACGTGHLMDIWTLWHPTYWLSGLVKASTAVISLATAVVLLSLLPQILAIPSNAELQAMLNELQRTQTHLIQTEKMSSLGQMIAGIAHEINNPISFIYGNLPYAHQYTKDLFTLVQIYQKSYPNPLPEIQEQLNSIDLDFLEQDLNKLLNSIKTGSERIREIVKSLRTFSRLDQAEKKMVNIHESIDSTLMILEHRLKQKNKCPEIKVIKEYGQLPLVECYAGHLNQVFLNIIVNAIDALEEGNQSLVPQFISDGNNWKHHSLIHQLPLIHINTNVLNEKWIAISIADNGPGIDENILSKLFDPFFTTKPVGKGIGIGLSISYQIIVEKHGGQLSCSSTPWRGTEFLIKIPIKAIDQVSSCA